MSAWENSLRGESSAFAHQAPRPLSGLGEADGGAGGGFSPSSPSEQAAPADAAVCAWLAQSAFACVVDRLA